MDEMSSKLPKKSRALNYTGKIYRLSVLLQNIVLLFYSQDSSMEKCVCIIVYVMIIYTERERERESEGKSFSQ